MIRYHDVKELVDFVLEYGKENSLPNMEGAGEAAYQSALRLQQQGLLKDPTMPKFKITATMDVGYELVVEAPDEDTAWQIANNTDDMSQWVKTDDGHDWTLENVFEVEADENSTEKEMVLPYLREMTERGDETAKKLLQLLEENDDE